MYKNRWIIFAAIFSWSLVHTVAAMSDEQSGQPNVVIRETESLTQDDLDNALMYLIGNYFFLNHTPCDNDYDPHLTYFYEEIKRLIGLGAHVDVLDCYGRSPMLFAAAHGRCDLALLFLRHGACVEIADDQGRTTLHYAAKNCWYNLVEQLLEAGADVDALDDSRMSPLKLAWYSGVYRKTVPVVRLLMLYKSQDTIAEEVLQNREASEKETARMLAQVAQTEERMLVE